MRSVCVLSHFNQDQLFVILWTIACQAPLSMGFSRQRYWSQLLCPPLGDLPDPGIEPTSLTSKLHRKVDSLPLTSLVAQLVKSLPATQETQFDSWV